MRSKPDEASSETTSQFSTSSTTVLSTDVTLPNGIVVTVILNETTTDNGGTVELVTDRNSPDYGKFNYTPDTNFSGTDSFTYTVQTETGHTDTATVTINIEGASDTYSYAYNSPDANDVPDTGIPEGTTYVDLGSTETIRYFEIGSTDSADILDLRFILHDEEDEENNPLGDYLTVTDSGKGNDVTIVIDSDRDGTTDLTLILEDAGTGAIDLATLTSNDQILIDQ